MQFDLLRTDFYAINIGKYKSKLEQSVKTFIGNYHCTQEIRKSSKKVPSMKLQV